MHPSNTEPVRIRAHGRSVKHFGRWTTARRFDVLAFRLPPGSETNRHGHEPGSAFGGNRVRPWKN